jgi:sterol 14-demethylase
VANIKMGILESIATPFNGLTIERGTVVIAAGIFSLLVVAVILNVLKQVLFKNPNEPPVVFHWFPVIGSTITYGIDPYKFFFDCRAKVC